MKIEDKQIRGLTAVVDRDCGRLEKNVQIDARKSKNILLFFRYEPGNIFFWSIFSLLSKNTLNFNNTLSGSTCSIVHVLPSGLIKLACAWLGEREREGEGELNAHKGCYC